MTDIPPKAGRREWWGLAVIALPCLLYSMDLTVLNLAVPMLSRDLQPTAMQLLWVVDIYGFMVAGLLIPMGALGDRIGRKRLLMIGAAAFGGASIAAAFATSAGMLIAMRALLGVAGATLAPSTLSLIRVMFKDDAQRSLAIGIWVACFSAGGAIGPLAGGALMQHFWWGSVFLMAVPVMVLLLAVGPWLLPEYRPARGGRTDVASVVLSLVGVLALVFAIKRVAESGGDGWSVGAFVCGVACVLQFIRRQRRLANPLVDLGLFARPAFGGALATYAIGTLAAFGMMILVTQHMQLVLGLGPLEAGLWTIPFVMALVAGSVTAPMATRRIGAARTMASGLVIAAFGFALLAQAAGSPSLGLLLAAFVVYAFGLAPSFALSTDLIVGAAPVEQAGTASALAETASEFGGALGIAVIGAIGSAIYSHRLAATMPGGVDSATRSMALETLGAAAEAAGRLADPLGPMLLKEAQVAFSQGLQWSAWATSGILLASAIVAGRVLPGRLT